MQFPLSDLAMPTDKKCKVFCTSCIFYSQPFPPKPFTQRDANSPETSKLWSKWEEEQKAREVLEIQQAVSRHSFLYEPHFLPYCKKWTHELQHRWYYDELGNLIKIYELCLTHNKEHDCKFYQSSVK